MKRRVLFLCLLIFFLFNLSSCSNKKEDKLVKMDCSGDFYIDELNTKYAYVFLSANRIVEYVIDNFVFTNDAKIKSYEFIEEKNSDGSFMQTKGYYEYGIVFLFEYMEFQFETFDIKINDTLKETIDLNLNVVIIPKSSNIKFMASDTYVTIFFIIQEPQKVLII